MENTLLDIHYVAGIIDGEGCIGFDFRKKNQNINVRIAVHMTNQEVLDRLCQQFGGCTFNVTEKNKPNNKDSYKWQLYSEKACVLLEQIKDILIIKRPQAYLAIEFQKMKHRISKETHLSFKALMHDLNKVGNEPHEYDFGEE